VKADEAERIGLVDKVVPAAQVYDEALAWAAAVPQRRVVRAPRAKAAIDRGLEVDLDTGLEIERAQFASLFGTEDRTAGMRSFVENGPGKAEFKGA
jgi:enoyl-CoA hydratase/carnithine racemase